MEISPRDSLKQPDLNSSNPQTPSFPNISLTAGQQERAGEASYEKHYPTGFQEQRVFNDPYAGRNPNYKEDKPNMHAGEGRNAMVNFDGSYVTPNLPTNVQSGPSIFQSDQRINVGPNASANLPAGQGQLPFPLLPSGGEGMPTPTPNPSVNVPPMQMPTPNTLVNVPPMQTSTPNAAVNVPLMQTSTPNAPVNVPPVQSNLPSDPRINIQPMSSINPPAGQGQLPLPLHSSGGNGVQTSHNSSSFLSGHVADGPQLANVNASSTVSSEQLEQLSHISASLAQLLESKQLPHLSSSGTPNGMSAGSNPLVSNTAFQPNQTADTLKKYDPICDSFDPKMSNSGIHTLPSLVEQKSSDNEGRREGGNVNQQEPLAAAKDGEDGAKLAEGKSKALENGPTEDTAVEDGAEDGKKSKDAKVTRPFKFALAEFVKELLKPTWKDGQVSKEAYKTIVKKVVDKVIETQGTQVPQTKEKIDQYLSCSKPKLDKLVQAYVVKYQKS